MAHLLVVGGSDAGTSAALRAREVDPGLEVTMVLADRYPNFSVCGLPFYISGEVRDFAALAHRRAEEIERLGVRLLLGHTVIAVDAAQRAVAAVDGDGRRQHLRYDKLVLATGATPIRPSLPGNDLPGVYVLRTAGDALALEAHLQDAGVVSVAIVGGGYIGCEMAEALRRRGLRVTLLETASALMPNMDPALGALAADELRAHGVSVRTAAAVSAISPAGGGSATGSPLLVHLRSGEPVAVEAVLLAAGVRPVTALAEAAGIELGVRGAIAVTRRMQTNVPGIYAAGDCSETWHRLLRHAAYLPLGSTAHKQGRVAGENAAGGEREFEGSLGTQIVKVYDLVLARTGLLEREACDAGLVPRTVTWQGDDHKGYYPGAVPVWVRLTAERGSGRLVGVQVAGRGHADVAGRINACAAAIACGLSARALEDLDLSYTPPLGTSWDVLQQAAQAWQSADGGTAG